MFYAFCCFSFLSLATLNKLSAKYIQTCFYAVNKKADVYIHRQMYFLFMFTIKYMAYLCVITLKMCTKNVTYMFMCSNKGFL